jgi:hypothetical protein
MTSSASTSRFTQPSKRFQLSFGGSGRSFAGGCFNGNGHNRVVGGDGGNGPVHYEQTLRDYGGGGGGGPQSQYSRLKSGGISHVRSVGSPHFRTDERAGLKDKLRADMEEELAAQDTERAIQEKQKAHLEALNLEALKSPRKGAHRLPGRDSAFEVDSDQVGPGVYCLPHHRHVC